MKNRITLILIFVSAASFAQTYDYVLVKKDTANIELQNPDIEILSSFDFNDNSYIAVTTDIDSIGFPLLILTQIDKNDLKIMFNSNGIFTSYKAFLFFFKNYSDNFPEIVILRIDHEWYTDLYAYINENDTIKEIGFLDVSLDPTIRYPSQDHLGYPIEEIAIKSINNQIVFSFKMDLIFNKNEKNLKMKHNDFKYIYDGEKLTIDIKN